LYNPRAVLWLLPVIEVLASFVATMVNVDVATPKNAHQQSVNRTPTEYQQSVNDFACCILYNSRAMHWLLHIIKLARSNGNSVNVVFSTPKHTRQQNVNRASTERDQSINNIRCRISYNPRAVLHYLPIFNILAAFVGKRVSNMVTAPV
jgi:hypothetical protein